MTKIVVTSDNFTKALNKPSNLAVLPEAQDQVKYMKQVSLPWLLLEATLSILNVVILLKEFFFERGSIKAKVIAINAE
jgi:hypothetical protein